MSVLLTLLGAVATVLLAVPRHPDRVLPDRLTAVAPGRSSGRGRRVLTGTALLFGAGSAVGGAAVGAGAPGAVIASAALIVVATTARLFLVATRQRRARRAQNDVALACGVLASYLRVGQVTSVALGLVAE